MPKKEYLQGSDNVVLEALKEATSEEDEPVTAYKVWKVGRSLNLVGPYTEQMGRSGGWQVFDFNDRVKRSLERLVRIGRAYKTEDGKYGSL